MAEHTQGEWIVEKASEDGVWFVDCESVGADPPMSGICKAYGRENANLIAAAPEMLEALEEIVVCFDEYKIVVDAIYLEEVKAAIAKAKGEYSDN